MGKEGATNDMIKEAEQVEPNPAMEWLTNKMEVEEGEEQISTVDERGGESEMGVQMMNVELNLDHGNDGVKATTITQITNNGKSESGSDTPNVTTSTPNTSSSITSASADHVSAPTTATSTDISITDNTSTPTTAPTQIATVAATLPSSHLRSTSKTSASSKTDQTAGGSCPPWLMLDYLQQTSMAPAWQNLVSKLLRFENQNPMNGVSFSLT